MSNMSGMRRDFIASNLRSQVTRLSCVLDIIEEERIDCNYAYKSLAEIENKLRQIRKLCVNN